MIQYDRITGAFTMPDGEHSQAFSELCSKLNSGLADVRSWLALKLSTGRYSHGFLVELSSHLVNRTLHVHAIYDEIGKLEGTDNRISMTKKPQQMRSILRGYWHKHYFQPSFMIRNLIDETEKMQKDGRWERIFAPHYGRYIDEIIPQIGHEMIVGAYEQRAMRRQVTGEFIVYERLPDGSNYYLTLGMHGEWEAIRAKIDEYKKFDAGE